MHNLRGRLGLRLGGRHRLGYKLKLVTVLGPAVDVVGLHGDDVLGPGHQVDELHGALEGVAVVARVRGGVQHRPVSVATVHRLVLDPKGRDK